MQEKGKAVQSYKTEEMIVSIRPDRVIYRSFSKVMTIIPLCHMPTKRTELLRTDIDEKRDFLANQPVETDGTPHEQTSL